MEPADWHCIWIDVVSEGFAVRCIPHGDIDVCPTHLAALIRGYAHDAEFRGVASQQGYE